MGEAVVAFVLEQVGELLIGSAVNEAKFLCGVDGQVEHARAELQRLRCLLKDADARLRRDGNEMLRNWVGEIREAAYDLEDAILTFASEVTPRRKQGVENVLKRFACLFCEGIELHSIGSKIERISIQLSTLRDNLQRHGISESGASSSNEAQIKEIRELRRAYSHVVEPDIVGLDEDINKLVTHLIESRNSIRVVSIFGMGGLGKTTLARQIYRHNKIRGHFNHVAWASISQQCQISSVWKEILLKLCPEEKENITERTRDAAEICRKLYDIQREKKCLIILDDIWTTEVWDRLSPAFPEVETKSKILLTTRNKDLAAHADENGVPRCLNDEESWALFQKVFKGPQANVKDYERKKELGKEMLKHCKGLPLAIIVLRGLLSRKHTVFDWEAMKKNVRLYINKGKLTELQDLRSSGVSWVLGLSYDELPYLLKPCFLHFANFPEDYEIKVDELCQIWMAEGFVSSEDVAYDCLYELVQRCMVLEGKLGPIDGRIRTCRVHDLMRDMCLSKAHEESFLKVTPFSETKEALDSWSSKVRRLAIFSADIEWLPFIRDNCLRSFTWFQHFCPARNMKMLFSGFCMLRVLKFEGLHFSVLIPKEIGKLFHLRFLSFKHCDANNFSVPSSISKLRCLQTLDLRFRLSLGSFRNVVMWRLDQLRHLYLPFEKILCGAGLFLENASNLRTIVNIPTSHPGFNHLAKLTNLTKLRVIFGEHWEGNLMFNSLCTLSVINVVSRERVCDVIPIILSCPRLNKLKVSMKIQRLPEDSQFSSELEKLTLNRTELQTDPMPTLEKLPKLKILRLLERAFFVDVIECSGGGFPQLESLHFSYSMMKEWRVEKGALPSLRRLTLDSCVSLRTIPDGLKYITTLKEIVFEGWESDASRSLKKGGDDFWKVQHVPSLIFNTGDKFEGDD